MPKPRYAQISAGETPYVHVVSRTVRRSFLCGKDKYSSKNFDHRRQWLEDEMLRLAGIFALLNNPDTHTKIVRKMSHLTM